MMSSKKCVEFFYDVVSPYSWFAFEVLCRYQSRWNMNLKFRPFHLGGIMHQRGSRLPNSAKLSYTQVDVQRQAKYFDVPLVIPTNLRDLMFGSGTLKAQRCLTALDITKPEKVEGMTRELWMRSWSWGEDIFEDSSFIEAGENIGLSREMVEKLLIDVKDTAIKEKVKKTTQEAIDLGAFGSPLIVVELDGQKEWVFGSDRFPTLAQMMGLITCDNVLKKTFVCFTRVPEYTYNFFIDGYTLNSLAGGDDGRFNVIREVLQLNHLGNIF